MTSHAVFTAVYIGRDLCSCDGVSRRGDVVETAESEERSSTVCEFLSHINVKLTL